MPTPTPHISAEPGDFAEAILLPGDPLRAQHIATNHLDDAREVTAVRNMLGFTGSYKGLPVSVMGTGMGIPSASIYANELVTEYGVRRMIRVGSCGGIASDIGLRDVILAVGACTDSNVNRRRYGGNDFAAVADFGLLHAAAHAAKAEGIAVRTGLVHTADLFYGPGARALAIMTVSDHVITHEATSSEERETTFDAMVSLALDTLLVDSA
ncbi:MAG: DeoD-type purine-nucleoside phosphorylase [Acidobacteriota bacterium]